MLFWKKTTSIIIHVIQSCWLVIIKMEIKKEPNGDGRKKSSERGKDRCLLSLPCLSLCLCPSCERSAVVAHNLYFIHYSQLHIDWEQGTYHHPAGGRERWKGRNVQLDQWNALMCIMSVCAGVCVRAWRRPCACCREPGVLMCDSQYSAVVPVEHIRLNQWCWHTNTHIHVLRTECCRGISFPLLPVCSDSGNPVVAETLVGSLMWHCRVVLTHGITLLRTS